MFRPEQILQPMAALGALTYLVLLRLPVVRFRAMHERAVTFDDFAVDESPRVSPALRIPNRNYMNLLELPTLFYAVCLGLLLLQRVSELDYVLAWLFVGLRAVHSLVHLTYNKVLHRFLLFASSNLVLAVLWLRMWLAIP